MSKYFTILFLLFGPLVFCQTVKPIPTYCPATVKPITAIDENTIYAVAAVEKKPEFSGGIEAFYKTFAAEFKMPADNPNVTGRIFVMFVVEKNGELSNIKILRDAGIGTGKETVRVLRAMPKWNPAEINGKVVRCSYTLPIKLPYEPSKLTAEQLKNIEAMPDKN